MQWSDEQIPSLLKKTMLYPEMDLSRPLLGAENVFVGSDNKTISEFLLKSYELFIYSTYFYIP